MATAMQSEATASMSVAEGKCRFIISSRLRKEDSNLLRYMQIWHDEVVERARAANPTQFCFSTHVTAGGRWAAELELSLPTPDFLRTRRLLAHHVVEGWLGCREIEDELFFAKVLRDWPTTEAKMVSAVIRSALENHFPRSSAKGREPRGKLRRFFRNAVVPDSDNEVWRTVFKAIGRYADMLDIWALGKTYDASQ